MTDPVPSREEFTMLRDMVAENQRRLDEIDRTGTRGVAVLAVQVSELGKDMGTMRAQLDKHESDHQLDAAARVSARRWAIGVGAALFAAVEGPLLGLLLTHLH